MTVDEVKEAVKEYQKTFPSFRWGQAVFNWCDEVLGTARDVQFKDRVDCFYDDSQVDKFIGLALKRHNETIDKYINKTE